MKATLKHKNKRKNFFFTRTKRVLATNQLIQHDQEPNLRHIYTANSASRNR